MFKLLPRFFVLFILVFSTSKANSSSEVDTNFLKVEFKSCIYNGCNVVVNFSSHGQIFYWRVKGKELSTILTNWGCNNKLDDRSTETELFEVTDYCVDVVNNQIQKTYIQKTDSNHNVLRIFSDLEREKFIANPNSLFIFEARKN